MTRFQVGIPLGDVNGNIVDTNALQSNMESIASDSLTHNIGQDTVYKAGAFQLQMSVLSWIIPDTDITQAGTFFNGFIAGYSFAIAPYAHNWSVN